MRQTPTGTDLVCDGCGKHITDGRDFTQATHNRMICNLCWDGPASTPRDAEVWALVSAARRASEFLHDAPNDERDAEFNRLLRDLRAALSKFAAREQEAEQ